MVYHYVTFPLYYVDNIIYPINIGMSKKKQHPILESLGVDPVEEDSIFDDELFNLVIPDDPALKDIVDLALKSYREQMNDMVNIEPKYRSRALEVAQMFLTVAKDCMVKKEDIRQKDEKIVIDKHKNGMNVPEEDQPAKATLSRAEILNPKGNTTH
jgi:hypothetical protein